MRLHHGTVIGGQVVLDEATLPDGAQVVVLAREPGEPVRLSGEELAELEAGLAEAERSETMSGDELFERLRKIE